MVAGNAPRRRVRIRPFALISQVEFWENFPKIGDSAFSAMPCGIGDSHLSADALRHWRRGKTHLIEGSSMRVLDDRYSRDWGKLNLALRFLMHEARTRTICVWTGLTQDRIRSLYRDYMNR